MRSSYLGEPNPGCFQNACSPTETCQCCVGEWDGHHCRFEFMNWRGRDGNDPSVDIAKDADQRF